MKSEDETPRRRHTWRAGPHITAWSLAGLVITAPLLLGGTPWPIQLGLAAFTTVVLGLSAAAFWRGGLRAPWPLWGPLVLVGLGLLQLVPLPTALLEFVSPKAGIIRTFTLGDLGLFTGHLHPISLDPAGTWLATFHQLAFAFTALIAANLSSRHRPILRAGIAISATIVAIIGLAHWSTGQTQIYGVYTPIDLPLLTGYFSTFVNNNTLAGLLNLGTLTALGVVVGHRAGGAKTLYLVAAGLCGLGVLLSGSRGGQGSLVLGLLVFAAFAHARGHSDDRAHRRRYQLIARAALLLGLVGLALSVLWLPDWASAGPEDPSLDLKFETWQASGGYIRDFWLTGSGRGTFEYVFPLYQQRLVAGTISHPEFIPVQLLTEWGVVGAFIALSTGIGGWFLGVRGASRDERVAQWGLLAGLASVGAQQLVDFGLEAPGLSLPVAAAFGLVISTGYRPGGQPKYPLGFKRRPRLARAALATAIIAALGLALLGPTLPGRRADAAVSKLREASDRATLAQAAKTATRAHPTDYIVALAAARRYAELQQRVPDTMRWLNRALYLFPVGGKAHLLAARVLSRAGLYSQATTEYQLSIDAMPWLQNLVLAEAVRTLKNPDHLARLVPNDARGTRNLGHLLRKAKRHEDAKVAMQTRIFSAPNDSSARRLLGSLCTYTGDEPCLTAQGQWFLTHNHHHAAHLFLAQAAILRHEIPKARHHATALTTSTRPTTEELRQLTRLYLKLGDLEPARDAALRLWRRVATHPELGAAALALEGRIEHELGDPLLAIRAYTQALAQHPRPGYGIGLLRAAIRAERPIAIMEAADELKRRWPTHPAVLKALKTVP